MCRFPAASTTKLYNLKSVIYTIMAGIPHAVMVHQNAVKFQTETLPVFLEAHQQLMHLCGHSGVISVVTPPSPRPRFMSFWKRKASSTPSGFRPTRCCTTASRTCSSAPSVGRRRKFVGITRTSAIGPAPRRDSPFRPLPAPQRGARARQHAGGEGIPQGAAELGADCRGIRRVGAGEGRAGSGSGRLLTNRRNYGRADRGEIHRGVHLGAASQRTL